MVSQVIQLCDRTACRDEDGLRPRGGTLGSSQRWGQRRVQKSDRQKVARTAGRLACVHAGTARGQGRWTAEVCYGGAMMYVCVFVCVSQAGDMKAKFKSYSKFPPCYKDMAFWISPQFSENNLCELVRVAHTHTHTHTDTHTHTRAHHVVLATHASQLAYMPGHTVSPVRPLCACEVVPAHIHTGSCCLADLVP